VIPFENIFLYIKRRYTTTMKPFRLNRVKNPNLGTWIVVFHALLIKTKFLSIFHPFKFSFTFYHLFSYQLGSSSLIIAILCLNIPLHIGGSEGIRWTFPNHLKQCWTRFLKCIISIIILKNINYMLLSVLLFYLSPM
jgi:hypothetical protein